MRTLRPQRREVPPPSDASIQSRNHPLLKRIRAIVRSGDLLDSDDVLLETPRLIEDAAASQVRINTLVIREPLHPAVSRLMQELRPETKIVRVPAAAFNSLASTETSAGAVALVEAPQWKTADLLRQPALLLIVAGVQDPGNLGTMLRCAEAFGFSGAILTQGTVSPWNAKAFRASAGSALRLPIVRNFSATETVQLLNAHAIKLYTAAVRSGQLPESIDAGASMAIAVGAEAAGLPEELQRASTPLSIPMAPQVDSLNAAAATAIMLYELSRHRTGSSKRSS